jgi:hypothetical protein
MHKNIKKNLQKSFLVLIFVKRRSYSRISCTGKLIKLYQIPRQASSSNGGPRLRVAEMPVDYKG